MCVKINDTDTEEIQAITVNCEDHENFITGGILLCRIVGNEICGKKTIETISYGDDRSVIRHCIIHNADIEKDHDEGSQTILTFIAREAVDIV